MLSQTTSQPYTRCWCGIITAKATGHRWQFSFPAPGVRVFRCNSSKKPKCAHTPLLGIFTVQHFSRMQDETLLKSDKQGAFGKINRTVSCVLYLWSAAFPWQLGATGFNNHLSAQGPCQAGGCRSTALSAPSCLHRPRGSEQPAQRAVCNGETEGKHKTDHP